MADAKVLVLVPVLGRPARASLVCESILESDTRAYPLFLCSPGDDAQIAACDAACAGTPATSVVVEWEPGGGDYAKKMNYGYEIARSSGFEWAFLGADDLAFHPGWLDACLRVWERTYACVIGTNDLGNSRVVAGYHSTHTLVHRDYLDCGGVADDPSRLLCELYDHNFVDDEFCQTAMARDTYAHAYHAMVEHLHPNWSKAEDDATYRKGTARFADDQRLFESRSSLFRPAARRRH